MGKDILLKRFFSDKRRFADIINAFGCGGEQYIQPEDLSEASVQEGIWKTMPSDVQKPSKKTLQKEENRDVIWNVAFGVNFAIIGIENQEHIDYSLPLRIMSYDTGRYQKQAVAIRHELASSGEKLEGSEFLYKFKKDSKLHPVVTFILYYGNNEYDGALDLHDIMDFTDIPDYIRDMVQNYHINLIDIRRIENFDMLHTDVKTVFEMIRDSKDKEKWKEHWKKHPFLDEDAYNVIEAYAGARQMKNIKSQHKEGGNINMCKAMDDWFDEMREVGIKEGREIGMREGIKKGIKEGISSGEKNFAVQLIKDGILSISEAASRLGLTQEQLTEYMNAQLEIA